MRTIRLALLAVLALCGTASAVTLTFDEVPWQPVDGLTVNGVTFGFSVGGAASSDAWYNAGGPGLTEFISDPSLVGITSGVLSIGFGGTYSSVSFGVALATPDPLAPGFWVELFDSSGGSLGTTAVATADQGFGFSEGWFDYTGTPAGRALVTFDQSSAIFAVDNLSAVPEPGTLLLVGSGLLGLVGLQRRSRRS